jgi:hypothetical protein
MPTRLPGSPAADPSATPAPIFTRSLCRAAISARGLDRGAARIRAMDVVSIVLGIAMFAVLYLLVFGIDAI